MHGTRILHGAEELSASGTFNEGPVSAAQPALRPTEVAEPELCAKRIESPW